MIVSPKLGIATAAEVGVLAVFIEASVIDDVGVLFGCPASANGVTVAT